MSKFKRIFQESIVHNTDQQKETFCETEFVTPHDYPFSILTLRTWRFHSLPSDLKIASKGCKINTFVRVDEAFAEGDFSMPETHMHFTEFRPVSDGFISVTSEGVTARASWLRKKNGDFILTDFEGRQAVISKYSIEEIISDEELKQWQTSHDYALETLEHIKALAKEKEEFDLTH
jgi:hypothetical protein